MNLLELATCRCHFVVEPQAWIAATAVLRFVDCDFDNLPTRPRFLVADPLCDDSFGWGVTASLQTIESARGCEVLV